MIGLSISQSPRPEVIGGFPRDRAEDLEHRWGDWGKIKNRVSELGRDTSGLRSQKELWDLRQFVLRTKKETSSRVRSQVQQKEFAGLTGVQFWRTAERDGCEVTSICLSEG